MRKRLSIEEAVKALDGGSAVETDGGYRVIRDSEGYYAFEAGGKLSTYSMTHSIFFSTKPKTEPVPFEEINGLLIRGKVLVSKDGEEIHYDTLEYRFIEDGNVVSANKLLNNKWYLK